MSEHHTHSVTRHCDVAVVGGSAAGLAAALQLGRQRRSVIVIDAGQPRNAPASHMHGYVGSEGTPPAEFLAKGREEVRRYGVEVLDARAEKVTRTDDGRFRVELTGEHVIVARRVLAATGMVDELPDIPGLADHWGQGVIHCPFCHGYEVRDRRIVQIVTHPASLHTAQLFRQLTDRHTIVLHGLDVDSSELALLEAAGVTITGGPVAKVLTDASGDVAALELADGTILEADVIAVGPRFRVRAEAFSALGLRPSPHPGGLGDVVEVDATGATSVRGVYAAGNVTDPSQQVLQAAAQGSRVGTIISFSLAEEDLNAELRWSGHETDWDHRYSGDQMWSGNPNGSLVQEAQRLSAGRALDVGAGEGADALWLAERGWEVTATDISRRALDRLDDEATRRGLSVRTQAVDANTLNAFEAGRFQLVSAQYAAIPRTPDHRAVHNLLNAVAPGGTLLIVSHDLEAMREPVDSIHSRVFDPDAYVGVDEFAAMLASSPDWAIEVHEKRPRPPGAARAHDIDDVVLRARRRAR